MSNPARDVFEQYENSPLAPWNEPDDIAVCGTCDKPMSEDDEFADVCDKCIENLKEEENE